MESKVIQAINKMIKNSHLIGEVIRSRQVQNEFYFLYDSKYKWSIIHKAGSEEDYILYYYHSDWDIDSLSNSPEEFVDYSTFKASDFKSKEADESFKELFNLVTAKLLGMDKIFDEILSDK